MKYSEGISRTEQEVSNEQKELDVNYAQNTLQQGILATKSDMIGKESTLKTVKNSVETAKRALESAKFANPFDVNVVLAKKTAVKQAESNVETAQEEYNHVKEAHDYLVALEQELFN